MDKAAFFDMDHTLISINAGEKWAKFLRRNHIISNIKLMQILGWVGLYKLSVLNMPSVFVKVVKSLRGTLETKFIAHLDSFLQEEILPAILPQARLRIAWHTAQQHKVVLLTSSISYLANWVAQELNIHEVLCNILAVEEGRFTGECVLPVCYGEGKVFHALKWSQQNNILLKESFFYTDSYTDKSMLLQVAHPIVINGDFRLRKLAKQQGWKMEQWQHEKP